MADNKNTQKKGKKDLATAQATTARHKKRRAASYKNWQERKRRRFALWAERKLKMKFPGSMTIHEMRKSINERGR